MIGSDLISGLHWWDEGARLISETEFIIFERLGYDQLTLSKHENYPKNNPIVVPEAESLVGMISSSEIRRRVQTK